MRFLPSLTEENQGHIQITIDSQHQNYEASFSKCKLAEVRSVLQHLLDRIDSGDFVTDEGIETTYE
jgi:hypothetical protein